MVATLWWYKFILFEERKYTKNDQGEKGSKEERKITENRVSRKIKKEMKERQRN
jgi:hypothetical protein